MPTVHRPPRDVRDPRELNALAHPVRMGILESLAVHGALTATELGERLDESAANCSWHLRKLAEHGFVEEPERGSGRRRPWQLVSLGFRTRTSESDSTPQARLAADAVQRVLMGRVIERLEAANTRFASEPPDWQLAFQQNQAFYWLTAEELRALNEEISLVMGRHLERLVDPSQRPQGARLCEFVAWGIPVTLGDRQA